MKNSNVNDRQTGSRRRSRVGRWVLGASCAVGVSLCGGTQLQASRTAGVEIPVVALSSGAKGPRHVGVKQCAKCHKKSGQIAKWSSMPHARAFEILASAEAKEMAKKQGIDDPQKSAKCLSCHETAYGEAKDKLARTFEKNKGVQCESCHGPGEKHFKARFRAQQAGGSAKVQAGEHRDLSTADKIKKVCTSCHNEKSPSFKGFKFEERCKEIAHLNKGSTKTPCK